MALVKCPECGKENVSDSAVSCPSCGYEIKAHFEAVKQREAYEAKQKERLEKIEMPSPPDEGMDSNEMAFLLFGFLMAAVALWGVSVEIYLFVILFGLCSLFFFWVAIAQTIGKNKQKKADYDLALQNFEEYQKRIIEREDQAARIQELQASTAPACPVCKSKNVKRINALERAVSVEIAGAASAKIGKQYQCNNCKHMW